MEVFDFVGGDGPLLVSIPHAGTALPDSIARRLTPTGRKLLDTDWHVDQLYQFAVERTDICVIRANYSRYVIDLNRATQGPSLYPGRRSSGLCPLHSFADQPLYRTDQAPDAAEVAERIESYWQPYHRRLAETLEQLRAQHGYALLWDAHSIASRVPTLFQGRLPDFNFGTNGGRSCADPLSGQVTALAERAGVEWVLDGRFRGGHITRHYGQPGAAIHAIQLELSQRCYLDDQVKPDRARLERTAGVIQWLLDAFVKAAIDSTGK